MKLGNIWRDSRVEPVVQVPGGVVEINHLVHAGLLPSDLRLAALDDLWQRPGFLDQLHERFLAFAAGDYFDIREYVVPEDGATFASPATNPEKIICIGLNYRRHAEETGASVPASPILFSKFRNALAGHLESIPIPAGVREVDYEAELAIVMGRYAKDVAVDTALSFVFGYASANDVSARDLQFASSQWLLGKTCDKFCPLGPWLVTRDDIPNPGNLRVQTWVNGEKRQDSSTSDLIFPCSALISYISRYLPLLPGDVILTGTPAGVILGLPREKRVWLKKGDLVSVEVEKLGRLTNRFV
ncbi:MAG TPA: fumarylacetoacetate hydrolase family protein [Spirochaetia bacterium]|nr:fumarylacetoacetate hydrolase family protein [Spirochaetia bacterium]